MWQCRYSGIEVPDDLWVHVQFGDGKEYSDNQAEDMVRETRVMEAFDSWTDRVSRFVVTKGKVEPGEFRAYGYSAPSHRLADLKAKWRELRMGVGLPPAGSSPARQHALGINDDATLRPKESEGDKGR